MPPLTLQRKLLLALTALLAAMVLLFVGLSRWGLQQGLGDFVAEVELSRMDWFAARLQQGYAEQGSWAFLRNDPQAWRRLQQRPRPERGPRSPGEPGPPGGLLGGPPPLPPLHGPGDGNGPPPRPESVYDRLMLLDAPGQQRLAGPDLPLAGTLRSPIEHAGQVIGQLALRPPASQGTEANRAFLARQFHLALWTGLGGLALALLLSWAVGRHWLRPIGALTAAARQVARGRLDVDLDPQGDDELAELSRTFNDMSQQLAALEASRQRWLTDVAHELRTPLAAMRAEIEALQDGVRRFDADTAARLHRQVMRLGQLVDDLRLTLDAPGALPLALSPGVAPVPLLHEAVQSMAERYARAGLGLEWHAPPDDLTRHWCMDADERRLGQVFMNLLENSLRYTHTGGRLRLQASLQAATGTEGPQLHLVFEDTAPAPEAHHLPRLADRFYRADASRSRDLGGSGLGLSIVKALVEAHQGELRLALSDLGGLRVELCWPIQLDGKGTEAGDDTAAPPHPAGAPA